MSKHVVVRLLTFRDASGDSRSEVFALAQAFEMQSFLALIRPPAEPGAVGVFELPTPSEADLLN